MRRLESRSDWNPDSRDRGCRPSAARQAGEATGRAIVIGPYLRMRRGDAEAQADDACRCAIPRRGSTRRSGWRAPSISTIARRRLVAPVSQIRPATYLGKGKVEEIAGLITGHDIELVVMDCALSPIQQRNLEKAWNTKVLDRTGLILEIFGRRANTKEGALQVELAHLNYQRSRLVRSWTHLERQRGGFGFMGGPGETQIEADRRLIGERIAKHRERAQEGASDARAASRQPPRVPYRDRGAGRLHQCRKIDAVQPPDPRRACRPPTCCSRRSIRRLRALSLPHGGKRVILSDTVGFISDLPTMLVAAFRATLEEVIEADVILHVRDISHEDAEAQQHDVEHVLRQLGIDPDARRSAFSRSGTRSTASIRSERDNLQNIAARRAPERPCFLVSAETGEGIDALLAAIEERLAATRMTLDLSIDAADGAGISWLHRNTEVINKSFTTAAST